MSFGEYADWNGFFGGLSQGLAQGQNMVGQQQAINLRQHDVERANRMERIRQKVMGIPPPDMMADGQSPRVRDQYSQAITNAYFEEGMYDEGMQARQMFLEHNHRMLSDAFRNAMTAQNMGDINLAAQEWTNVYKWMNNGEEPVNVVGRDGMLIAQRMGPGGEVLEEAPIDTDDMNTAAMFMMNPERYWMFQDSEADRESREGIAEADRATRMEVADKDLAGRLALAGVGKSGTKTARERVTEGIDTAMEIYTSETAPGLGDGGVDPGLLRSQADRLAQFNGDNISGGNAVQVARILQQYRTGTVTGEAPKFTIDMDKVNGLFRISGPDIPPMLLPQEMVPPDKLQELMAAAQQGQNG